MQIKGKKRGDMGGVGVACRGIYWLKGCVKMYCTLKLGDDINLHVLFVV